MRRTKLLLLGFLTATFIFSSCKKDDETNPNGFAEGVVTESGTSTGLPDVLITVFDSNTNLPVISTKSDAEGNFKLEVLPGSYYVRLSKQSYQDIPPLAMSPVPFNIVQGGTASRSYEMTPIEGGSAGWISGRVAEGTSGTGGALVVAENGGVAFSAVSDHEGNFTIYNVQAGTYKVKAWLSGFNSNEVSASVVANEAADGIELSLTGGTSGVFKGQIRNLATENKDVDIALVHPITGQTIPGLTTSSSSQAFEIANVPAGTYVARATYENDQRVMDPDRIAKFGEPVVTISNTTEEITFDITNSVNLKTPTNSEEEVVPVEIAIATPTFEWTAYSSTSDYVIEVSDVNGTVIWGGFSEVDGLPGKNVTVPSSQISATYNFDGSASISELEAGKIYRWRVYASKNDKNATTGWTLISASEDQRGLFKVVE